MNVFLKALSILAALSALGIAQVPTKSGNAVAIGSPGSYPRATKLKDGSLLAIYERSDGGNTIMTTARSTNNGASWANIGTVDSGDSSKKDIANGFVHQLPSGNILAAFRNHDRIDRDTYSFYRITVCNSSDNGATWSYLSTPASDPGDRKEGNWEPFMKDSLDGTLELYYSRENPEGDQDSLLRRSTDGGKSWSTAQTISGQGLSTRDGMLGVARIAPNSPTEIAIFEAGLNGLFTVNTIRSSNDGTNWTRDPNPVYAVSGKSAGAPQIIRVGNRLVASFGTNEGGGAWPEDGAINLLVSRDNGQSWGDKTFIDQPAHWAGLLALDDTSFLVLYDKNRICYSQRMTF
ncbi:glycoside hydrolase family 93 protein [Polyplosphaeria fusca]|uniref:Glycoside hydrolase family 93 protein n=1 Tax=Polyplosphaeria fusca TaxID=682080 RepID=A0A9P4V5H1_9PLEO|nr:glycoside hydrolase family 93 protein [Polyplosphaeria fusca]